jgi:hypothetical protein
MGAKASGNGDSGLNGVLIASTSPSITARGPDRRGDAGYGLQHEAPRPRRVLRGIPTTSRCVDWLGTAAARFGFAFDRTMVFVKGGGAWVHDKYDASFFVTPFTNIHVDDTRWGWTFGSGIEHAFYGNWSAKVETTTSISARGPRTSRACWFSSAPMKPSTSASASTWSSSASTTVSVPVPWSQITDRSESSQPHRRSDEKSLGTWPSRGFFHSRCAIGA